MTNNPEQLLDDGAQLVISISGGKDSDAMARVLVRMAVERGWKQPVAVHADLGRNEWLMTPAYVEKTVARLGVPLYIVRRPGGDLMARWTERHEKDPNRVHWSSAANRYCTSDLKRGPIDVLLRKLAGKDGHIICAMGLRAEESPTRAKLPICDLRQSMITKTLERVAINWLPIHEWTEEDVWQELGTSLDSVNDLRAEVATLPHDEKLAYIEAVGWPWHPAYPLGNERVSCSLCVLASKNDLRNGAKWNPDHYQEVVALETRSGFSFRPKMWLKDLEVSHG